MDNKKGMAENLIPAEKGEVRNPKGRPLGSVSMRTLLRRLTEMEFDELKSYLPSDYAEKFKEAYGERTYKEMLAIQMLRDSLDDYKAREQLLDRMEGKVAQGIDLVSTESATQQNWDKAKKMDPEAASSYLMQVMKDQNKNKEDD